MPDQRNTNNEKLKLLLERIDFLRKVLEQKRGVTNRKLITDKIDELLDDFSLLKKKIEKDE